MATSRMQNAANCLCAYCRHKRKRAMLENVPTDTAFARLPRDILHHIILMLPTKSVFRLRSVSKFWYATLSDCECVHSYLSHGTKNPGYLCATLKDNKLGKEDTYFAKVASSNVEATKICGGSGYVPLLRLRYYVSSGGLIACYQQLNKCFYICNPLVGEPVTVQFCPRFRYDQGINWGFGFSPSTREYKIVMICTRGDSTEALLLAAIYVLGSYSWRQLSNVPVTPNCGRHVECRGTLFWLTVRGPLLTFDVKSENFQTLPYPPIPSTEKSQSSSLLVNWRDTIAYASSSNLNNLSVWTLRERVKGTWINQYKFSQEPSSSVVGHACFISVWATFLKIKSEQHLETLFSHNSESAELKAMKSLFGKDNEEFWKVIDCVVPHAVSLLSPSDIIATAREPFS